MKRGYLAVAMLLAGTVLATAFGACGGGGGGGADAGRRDGSIGPPPGKDAQGACLEECSGETPVCNGAGQCVCTDTSCEAGKECKDGQCVAIDKCAGNTCGAEEPCDPADGLCKCTATSCTTAPKTVCSASHRCVEPGDPCETKVCEGTTPVCNAGSCECSAFSCGTGQECVGGACQAKAGPDAGTPRDGGIKPAIEVTVQQMNDRSAAGHEAFAYYPNNKVHFKAVVASPFFRDYRKSSGTDPAGWYCRMGVYLADPNATTAEHNGILLTSRSTVLQADAGTPTPGNCAEDSPLEQLAGAEGLEIGEEIEVTGFFKEDCYRTHLNSPDGGTGVCDDKDQDGNELARVTVEVNSKASFGVENLVRTGNKPGLPASLPAVVSIDDITHGAMSGTAPNVTVQVGPKWFDYRQTLVKVEDVKVTVDNGPSCNFTVQKSDGTGGTLIVQDDVMFAGTSCPLRPAKDTVLQSLTGFQTWYTSSTQAETQLAPRGESDIVRQ